MSARDRVIELNELIFPRLEELHARNAAMIERGYAGENVEAEMVELEAFAREILGMIQERNRLMPRTLD